MKAHSKQSLKQLDNLLERAFYCPSCTTWRTARSLSSANSSRPRQTRSRYASTTSSTAINATKNIPSSYRPLYDALQEVRKKASAHIGQGRLSLALQGLESDRPTVRIAVLGLNVADTARQLVRLLLADALETEEKWETDLANDTQYAQGVLVRYGHPTSSSLPRRTTIPVLQVPAPILERLNLEIIISAVNAPGTGLNGNGTPIDTFLAPTVGTPTDASGRQTTISQPVHRALLLGNGVDELVETIRLFSSAKFETEEDRSSIAVVADLVDSSLRPGKSLFVTDVAKAQKGIDAIRETLEKATVYEHCWIDANIPQVSEWLISSSSSSSPPLASTSSDATDAQKPQSTATPLPPPVRDLITSVLTIAQANLDKSRLAPAVEEAKLEPVHGLSLATRSNLDSVIDEFSRSAHEELQSGLSSAWQSRNWRKLAWYKLFWRVDDVGLIITDLVSNAWLPKTERAAYELSGRLIQVGISPIVEGLSSSTSPFEETEAVSAFEIANEAPVGINLATASSPAGATDTAPSSILPRILSAVQPRVQPQVTPLLSPSTSPLSSSPSSLTPTSVPTSTSTSSITGTVASPATTPSPATAVTKIRPLSTIIPSSRAHSVFRAITSLTSNAQQLVLRTLSISGLSAGLSSLLYVSSLSASVYEAGTVFAVGTVVALWRMQSSWLRSTRNLEQHLFDEGRRVVDGVVDGMRGLVERKSVERPHPTLGGAVGGGEEVERQAQEAIRTARAELDKLEGKSTDR